MHREIPGHGMGIPRLPALATHHAYKSLRVDRHEERWMKRSSAWAVPVVARWWTLPIERQLHWLLRVGVIGCFIGHGAYGLLTKEAWVPYFGVVGIDRTWAYRLMPWIGVMDVGLGLTMAVVPLPIVLLHLTIWGIWTAALRPLSGDSVWEFIERAGNYGMPLAFLILAGVPRSLHGWFAAVGPADLSPLTINAARTIHSILRVTICLLLLGHGGLGAFNSSSALTAHYASIGFDHVAVGGLGLTQLVGGFKIVVAVAVLVAPLPGLLLSIAMWKMATEALFMTSGALPFEWIERAGSYVVPLTLYSLVLTQEFRHGPLLFPQRPLTPLPQTPGARPRGPAKRRDVPCRPHGGAIQGIPTDEVTVSGTVDRGEEGGFCREKGG
jgi:hypothetical protein